MRLRSKLDGAILNAELRSPPEDVNYGSRVLMTDNRVTLNMVEAQRDYELLSATPEERAILEEEGYFLSPAGRE
jgi:hypothetical protein